jgi:endonuclease YncB( thermonuclease family)
MLGCRLPERGHDHRMKKAPKAVSYRRWPKRRPRASAKRSNAKFVAMVVVVAMAAFAGTLFWPRSADLVSAQVSSPHYDFSCDVAYVNDGDTLRCQDGTRIRLHAVAARETDNSCSPGHPCPTASAAASTAALTRLAGSRITCIRIGQSYERVTAICHNTSGVEINCAMVESGAALIWDRFNRQRPMCRS